MSWRTVWERKGQIADLSKLTMANLLTFDGYDLEASKITEYEWRIYVTKTKEKLKIKSDNCVCEVGCGAGALLYVLFEQGIQVSGIDYSDTLIAIARQVMPKMVFHVGEANKLPFAANEFEAVLSCSVFHYFSNLDYAEEVFWEMYRIAKPNGMVMIMDIPDFAKREAAESYHRKLMPPDEYERLYANYPHLYYHRDWFKEIAKDLSGSMEVFDHDFPGYGNAPYRFNVAIVK